jgi:hypothetical protein
MIQIAPHRGSARPILIGGLQEASGAATIALGFGLALAKWPATQLSACAAGSTVLEECSAQLGHKSRSAECPRPRPRTATLLD